MSKNEIKTDYLPMEAQLVKELPASGEWQFEPKWDGFRCLAHKHDSQIDLVSKNGQPLARYFPEVVHFLQQIEAEHFVLDGELVVPEGRLLSFDKLLQRIHPAESRINKLSKETPANYIVFDLLVTEDGDSIVELPLSARREKLEKFSEQFLRGRKSIAITPATQDIDVAREWLEQRGSLTDGVIAKRLDSSYQSGNRKGMLKVKRKRTADCVIGGFRYGTNSSLVGSLLLGLYDFEGELHHVGFTSGLAGIDKKKLTSQLEQLKSKESFTVNVPGAPSRWSTERSTSWQPVKPELVIEVEYDHISNGRFRHGTKLLRWRPDKAAKQCMMDQIKVQ